MSKYSWEEFVLPGILIIIGVGLFYLLYLSENQNHERFEFCQKLCETNIVVSCTDSKNILTNKEIIITVCLIEKDKYNLVVSPK